LHEVAALSRAASSKKNAVFVAMSYQSNSVRVRERPAEQIEDGVDWLQELSEVSVAVAAVIITYAYTTQRIAEVRRRHQVEKLLAERAGTSLSLRQIAVALKMTEDQVAEAASRCSSITAMQGGDKNAYLLKWSSTT
jgi:hypothetical protein